MSTVVRRNPATTSILNRMYRRRPERSRCGIGPGMEPGRISRTPRRKPTGRPRLKINYLWTLSAIPQSQSRSTMRARPGYSTSSGVALGNGTVISYTASGGTLTTVTITAGGSWPCASLASAPTAIAVPGGTGGTVNLTVAGAGVAYGMGRLSSCYTTNSVVGLTLVNNGTVDDQNNRVRSDRQRQSD